MGAETQEAKPSRRFDFGLGLALLAAGAAVVLLALNGVWIAGSLVLPDYPRVDAELTGADVAGLARAAAFVALAGVVAILATRGVGRIVVGALVTAAGGLVFVDVILFVLTARMKLDAHLLRIIDEPTMSLTATEVRDGSVWPYVALVGGVLIVAGGVLTILRGRTWPAMGSRYDSPTRSGVDERTPDGAWAALDRGSDPTR